MTTIKIRLFAAVVACSLAACASTPDAGRALPSGSESGLIEVEEAGSGATGTDGQSLGAGAGTDAGRETLVLGSGVFVQGAGTGKSNGYAAGEGVTLNFEAASLPEFLRVVFETILQENTSSIRASMARSHCIRRVP